MAVATIIHNFSSDGSYIARGTTTDLDDGETVVTGLKRVDGFIATANTADAVVTMTSQSSGTVTVAAKTAGVASSAITIYWEAWTRPYKA